MLKRTMKVALASLLLLNTVTPGLTAFAEETKKEAEAPVEKKEEVTGTGTDSKPESGSAVGLDDTAVQTLHKKVQKVLVDLGGTGKAISGQFTKESKKVDDAKLFNSIILTQLELYELLYGNIIDKRLEAPVKESKLGESEEFGGLKHYITAYNIINTYLDQQIKTL
ncbi:hypothetical protein, partial [Lysinibacillus xylanilyticus]|uniref:hypothetical protein n=1 Tax=Lysinibacillus xylanilyticus TaxID=582475 RepID=UPI0036DB3E2C